MGGDRVYGITAPVEAGTVEGAPGHHGIGACAAMSPAGELLFALSIVHEGGATLTAALDEEAVHRLADMMADYVEMLPAIQSEARH